MPTTGYARWLGGLDEVQPEDCVARPDVPNSPTAAVVDRWLFGGYAPAPVPIPYTWLAQPLRFRPDPPINVADVTSAAAATVPARSVGTTSRAEYGEASTAVTSYSALPPDPQALAGYLTGSYADPRVRCPNITLDLLQRTDVERWLILAAGIGTRITITGAPATWPEGTTSLIVEGVAHTVGIDDRTVVWNTAPVVGSTAGIPGPWFRTDASAIGATDKLPY